MLTHGHADSAHHFVLLGGEARSTCSVCGVQVCTHVHVDMQPVS